MGRAARTFVEQKANLDLFVDRIAKILREVCSARGSPLSRAK